MWNTDYFEQLERAREHLFGGCVDPVGDREALAQQALRYRLPPDVELVECVEDSNGEWVPARDAEGKLVPAVQQTSPKA